MGKTLSLLIIALFITFLGIIAASAQQLKFNAGIEISYHSGQNIGFERKDYGVLRYDYDNLSILTQLRLKYK